MISKYKVNGNDKIISMSLTTGAVFAIHVTLNDVFDLKLEIKLNENIIRSHTFEDIDPTKYLNNLYGEYEQQFLFYYSKLQERAMPIYVVCCGLQPGNYKLKATFIQNGNETIYTVQDSEENDITELEFTTYNNTSSVCTLSGTIDGINSDGSIMEYKNPRNPEHPEFYEHSTAWLFTKGDDSLLTNRLGYLNSQIQTLQNIVNNSCNISLNKDITVYFILRESDTSSDSWGGTGFYNINNIYLMPFSSLRLLKSRIWPLSPVLTEEEFKGIVNDCVIRNLFLEVLDSTTILHPNELILFLTNVDNPIIQNFPRFLTIHKGTPGLYPIFSLTSFNNVEKYCILAACNLQTITNK